jgi:hypothetical protein
MRPALFVCGGAMIARVDEMLQKHAGVKKIEEGLDVTASERSVRALIRDSRRQ